MYNNREKEQTLVTRDVSFDVLIKFKLINLNLISKETSRAEHEYMNKHPPINVLTTAVAITQQKAIYIC